MFKLLFGSSFWLLGIGAGLIAIHLTIVAKATQEELFSTSMLFWIAVGSMIWQKRDHINIKGTPLGTVMGVFLIVLVLFKSQTIVGADIFLRLLPLLSGLGLGLIASGFRGLRQYWQELIILSFLIPHSGLLSYLFDLSNITAQFSASLLWYVGFDASHEGSVIFLPTGSVGVNPGCSGYGSIMQLLGISIIFLFMFSIPLIQKFIIPLIAVLIAFVMNGIRVSIMTVLAVSSNPGGFRYWHDEEGSLLFSVISVFLLGLICFFLIQQNQPVEEE